MAIAAANTTREIMTFYSSVELACALRSRLSLPPGSPGSNAQRCRWCAIDRLACFDRDCRKAISIHFQIPGGAAGPDRDDRDVTRRPTNPAAFARECTRTGRSR